MYMMTQGELAFKYEVDRQGVGMTGMEQDEKEYPFRTMVKDKVRYKVFGIPLSS